MSITLDDLSNAFGDKARNFSAFGLPLALALAAFPHWYTIALAEINHVQGGWSNVNPRAWVQTLVFKGASGKKLSSLERTILRGQSCQANAFENSYLFAATLAIANVARLPNGTINKFTAFWLVTRVIFTLLYLNTESYAKSFIRTIAFNAGIIYVFRIWYLAHFNLY